LTAKNCRVGSFAEAARFAELAVLAVVPHGGADMCRRRESDGKARDRHD
jgi:hypothetical protein